LKKINNRFLFSHITDHDDLGVGQIPVVVVEELAHSIPTSNSNDFGDFHSNIGVCFLDNDSWISRSDGAKRSSSIFGIRFGIF
jgi:hypothetical protein